MSDLRAWLDEPLRRLVIEARLMRPYRVRQFQRFGDQSIVHRPAWISGARHMSIGAGVLIMRGAWLAVEQLAWSSEAAALVLGDRVWIRAGCTISAAAGVELGDDVVVGAMCSIVDSDHTWRGGDQNVLRNPVAPAAITIGAGSWLADGVRVLKGSTIGERCAIGANAVVRGDIPAGSVAVGSPARVVGEVSGL